MKLQEMLHYQVEKALKEAWPLFLPAGTIEYHGEHLPLGVDTIAVLKALDEVEKVIPCVIAPVVWYGPSSYAVAGRRKGPSTLTWTGSKGTCRTFFPVSC